MRKIVLSIIAILAVSLAAMAQNLRVTGTVTDSEGAPQVGATVVVKGSTSIATATGLNGEYTLNNVAPDATLVFSLIGMVTEEVPVAGKTTINVQLKQDAQNIEDVIVVGYGSGQKIGNVVGSVSTVTSAELTNRPTANIGDALQGKVAGLQVFNTSGEPNSTSTMTLRGVATLNLSTAPLYVLDGVPVTSSVFLTVSPQDIENISILKDASSTAIYGSRAANGVIYITTKKGKAGQKPTISFRFTKGVSMLTDYCIDMMSSEELFKFEEMCDPSRATDPAYQARKAYALGNNINFDWKDYLYNKSAPTTSADASIRGGTENTNYYVGVGYHSEDGVAKIGSSTNRATFRTNLDTKITDWLRFGSNVSLAYRESNAVTTGWYTQSPILQAVTGLPYYTPYDLLLNEDGTLSYGDVPQAYPWDGMMDLLQYYKSRTGKGRTVDLTGQVYLQFTPVKGLNIKTQGAVTGYDSYGGYAFSPNFTPYTYRGRVGQSFERYYQLSTTNTAEYKFNIAQEHFVTLLAGQEAIVKKSKGFNATGTGLTDDRLIGFGSTTDISSWGGSESDAVFNSFFGNMNYNYKGKYFVDASVRTDGSSLFGKNNRYATFFSVGAMWKIKEEEFMRSVDWVQALDVNVSYGTTGNSGLASWYESLGLVGTGPKYNGNAGWGLAQVPNADLTWETVGTTNITIRGRVLNRLDFNFEFYNRTSTDLLMDLPLSGTTGHTSATGNIASMYNRGVDVMLSVDLVRTKNWAWYVTTNFNYNKNAITKLYQDKDELPFTSSNLKYKKGYSATLVYMPVMAGVDPDDGMVQWYDRNGNLTKQYSDDLYQFHPDNWDSVSPWSGGFQTNVSYKGLGLSADFTWIGNRYIWVNERYYTRNPKSTLGTSNFERVMLDMWTTPGQQTNIPGYANTFKFDDRAYSNAAFLRLKNVTLSYTLQKKALDKLKIVNGFKVYLTGRNLWTVTDFEGYDPEVGAGNGMQGLYPNSRQIVGGLEITF